MITSKRASVIVLAGLLGVVTTQQGCGSDTSGPSGGTTAGSSGAAAAGAPSGVSGGGSSGMAAAGAPAAGAPAGGGGAGGTGGSAVGGGAGGATAGSGGSGGSSAGAGGGGAGGGASTFTQVSAIFTANCATAGCHDGSNMHLNYKTGDLHTLLTTAIPTGIDRCVGSTLVVPNDLAKSFLVTAIKTGGNCPTGGNKIGRMPDNCGQAGKPACLTDAQIKTITDWISAGAPK